MPGSDRLARERVRAGANPRRMKERNGQPVLIYSPRFVSSLRDALFLLVMIALLGCWYLLSRWYALSDYVQVRFFALDKLEGGIHSARLQATLGLVVAISLLYWVGWRLLRGKRPAPIVRGAVIIGGLAMMALAAYTYPVTTHDIFNYVLHAKQAYFYRQNPYLVPFEVHWQDPFCRYGFFQHVPLGYGPAWLAFAAIPAALTSFTDLLAAVLAFKWLNVFLLLITAWTIVLLRGRATLWSDLFLFMANPLLLFDGLVNGHNDVFSMAPLMLAWLAVRRRSWLAVPLVVVAGLVKFFLLPVLPLVLIVMWLRRWPRRLLIYGLLAGALVFLLLVAPWWAGGRMLAGLREGMNTYASIDSTSLFSLLREHLRDTGAPGGLQALVWPLFAGLYSVIAAAIMRAHHAEWPLEQSAVPLTLAFILLVSLHFPWYMLPVIALLVVEQSKRGMLFLFVYSGLALVYHVGSVWLWFGFGLSPGQVHLAQAGLLTVPALIDLGARLAELWAGHMRTVSGRRPWRRGGWVGQPG
ncbi:MAG: hypothetical protein H5T69_11035 [Chloroflexi bacterium]|nr:hypothetical protein [Chloroflexota bacterium]